MMDIIALILAAVVTSDYGAGAFRAPHFLGRMYSPRTALGAYSRYDSTVVSFRPVLSRAVYNSMSKLSMSATTAATAELGMSSSHDTENIELKLEQKNLDFS